MTPGRLRSLCGALFTLNLAYCTTALFTDTLPAWKMFETVEALNYRLSDATGDLDASTVLPGDSYLIDRQQLLRVVTFICERHKGALWFEPTRGSHGRWLRQGSCQADVQR